jgi:enamine deaminase RidA (YjgF/YER057c/UK114 family)
MVMNHVSRPPVAGNIGIAAAGRNGTQTRPALPCLNMTIRSAKTAPLAAHAGEQRISESCKESLMAQVEKKLADLAIVLPTPPTPVANYVPFVRTGSLLFVSGQICLGPDGKLVAKGKLGDTVSIEDGQKAARICAVNLLAQLKVALGDLDKLVRVVRLGGFINSAPTFLDGPKVMNGASDLMVEAFGDKGRHARTTVGVAALPADAAVEVEGLFEVV